jgi:hypothetical protein
LQHSFFFLCGPTRGIGLDRAQATDLFVEGYQFGAQALHLVERGDFALGFAEGCGDGKGLGDGLAVDFADETKLQIVAWIVGLGAMTVGFTAAAGDGADGTWAKITEDQELLQDGGALGFQIGKG